MRIGISFGLSLPRGGDWELLSRGVGGVEGSPYEAQESSQSLVTELLLEPEVLRRIGPPPPVCDVARPAGREDADRLTMPAEGRTLEAFPPGLGIEEALVGGDRPAALAPLDPLRPPTLSSSNLRGLALRWVRS
jgi:hypothetical protein